MAEYQTFITVILALVIGFILGRGTRKSDPFVEQNLTREEWQSLQPKDASFERNDPYDDAHQDVVDALKSNNKLEAIKRYREHHGSGLREAKEAIEAIFKNLKP